MKQGERGEAMGRVWRGEESAAAVVLVGGAARGTAIGLGPIRQLFQKLSMDLSHPGQSRDAEGRHPAAHPGLGAWVGARVASPRGPILRPGSSSRLGTAATWQFPVRSPWRKGGDRMARDPRGPTTIGSEAAHAEEDSRRSEVREDVFYRHANEKLHLYL